MIIKLLLFFIPQKLFLFVAMQPAIYWQCSWEELRWRLRIFDYLYWSIFRYSYYFLNVNFEKWLIDCPLPPFLGATIQHKATLSLAKSQRPSLNIWNCIFSMGITTTPTTLASIKVAPKAEETWFLNTQTMTTMKRESTLLMLGWVPKHFSVSKT